MSGGPPGSKIDQCKNAPAPVPQIIQGNAVMATKSSCSVKGTEWLGHYSFRPMPSADRGIHRSGKFEAALKCRSCRGAALGQLREIAILQFKGRMNRVTPGGFFFSFFSFSIWPI
jgi:hypothetical protein